MKNTRGIIAVVLIAAIFLSIAGCNSDNKADSDGGTVLLTVGDRKIGDAEARYFLYSSVNMMRTYLPYIGWDDVIEGVPVREYALNEAVNAMKLYYVTHAKAAELSVGLTDEQRAGIDMWVSGYIDYFGSEEAYLENLAKEGLTDEMYRYFSETDVLRNNIKEALFGENGPNRATDGQLIAYAAERGYDFGIDPQGVREAFTEEELAKLMDEWSREVKCELSEEFNNIDIKELYDNFNASLSG